MENHEKIGPICSNAATKSRRENLDEQWLNFGEDRVLGWRRDLNNLSTEIDKTSKLRWLSFKKSQWGLIWPSWYWPISFPSRFFWNETKYNQNERVFLSGR